MRRDVAQNLVLRKFENLQEDVVDRGLWFWKRVALLGWLTLSARNKVACLQNVLRDLAAVRGELPEKNEEELDLF